MTIRSSWLISLPEIGMITRCRWPQRMIIPGGWRCLPLEERDSLFGRFMAGMIYDWHANGRLIELEKKWGIQPTAYVQTMHEKFKPNRAHLE
jgi:hypothetical protein